MNGVKVGHATDQEALTGVTAVVFNKLLAVAWRSDGGSAGVYPGTPDSPLRKAIFIAGGSLDGLRAVDGIANRLSKETTAAQLLGEGRERAIGQIRNTIMGAVVWDLGKEWHIEVPNVWRSDMGHMAALSATEAEVINGNVGAGTGASVGKFAYEPVKMKIMAMKGGVGSGAVDLPGGVMVRALTVVNAVGNVIASDGSILAGNRSYRTGQKFRTFESSSEFLTGHSKNNTTISIVGTNVDLGSYSNYQLAAKKAAQGWPMAIRPVGLQIDGDTLFFFSTEEIEYPLTVTGKDMVKRTWPGLVLDIIGNAAANAVRYSIYNAVESADTVVDERAYDGVIPAVKDIKRS